MFSYFYNYFFSQKKTDISKLTDYYYLSLLKEDNGTYTIHGLWPQYSESSYPTYCKKVVFDISALKPILNKLNKYWYSSEEPNSDFWKHEYEKHGSCMFKDMTEFEYFNTVLNLYQKAITDDLPKKFYNPNLRKCLIPVNQEFEFIL